MKEKQSNSKKIKKSVINEKDNNKPVEVDTLAELEIEERKMQLIERQTANRKLQAEVEK